MIARSALALAVVLVTTAACSANLLGPRETCWDESEPRMATLWRGVLDIDASGAHLDTPEDEVVPLLPGTVQLVGTDLIRGSDVVARIGDDITVFGGAGSDGAIVVCAIEENRGGS